MASYRAPGVQVKEIDLSEVTVPAGTNVGALVGRTLKGMTNRRVLTTSNKDLVSKFGAPINGDEYPTYTAIEFLKASDFLWFTRPATSKDEVGYLALDSEGVFTPGTQPEAPSKGLFSEEGYEDGNQPNKYWPGEQLKSPLAIVALGASAENSNIGIIVVTESNTETQTMDYTYGYTWAGKYPETNINGNPVKYYRINVYTKTSEQSPEDAGWTSLDPLKTLVPTESWVVSNDPLAKDYSGNSMYVKDVVNGYSDFIYVNTDGTDIAGRVYPQTGMILNGASILLPAGEITSVESADIKLDLGFAGTPEFEDGFVKVETTGMIGEETAVMSLNEDGNIEVEYESETYTFAVPSGWEAENGASDKVYLKKVVVSGPANSVISLSDPGTWGMEENVVTYAPAEGENKNVISIKVDGDEVAPTFVSTSLRVNSKNVEIIKSGKLGQDPDAGVVECWNALYSSKEQVTPNILMAPYVKDREINEPLVQAVCDIASSRRDCFAVVPATGLNTTNAQKIVDGLANKGYMRNSYVGIYAGTDLVYDQYTNKNIYLPKVAFAGRIIANNDNVAHVWDAPAGLNRGAMGTLDQMKVYTEQEIGYMYANNINTSKRVRGAGDYMWGQKTGQVKASALDRINVRRLLLYIENTLEPSLQAYLFEPNTELLRSRVKSGIDQFLQTIYAGGGLYAYNTVCDSTNNTPYTIDNNELNIDLYVQPVKTVEFINLNIIVTRTGVSFTES